jgi:hypothetical protein
VRQRNWKEGTSKRIPEITTPRQQNKPCHCSAASQAIHNVFFVRRRQEGPSPGKGATGLFQGYCVLTPVVAEAGDGASRYGHGSPSSTQSIYADLSLGMDADRSEYVLATLSFPPLFCHLRLTLFVAPPLPSGGPLPATPRLRTRPATRAWWWAPPIPTPTCSSLTPCMAWVQYWRIFPADLVLGTSPAQARAQGPLHLRPRDTNEPAQRARRRERRAPKSAHHRSRRT